MAEWFLFLPQVRLDIPAIVERAHVAEASGFDGIAFIDHLEAPGTANQSIWEAMAVATWVAARTERLQIGHLVLCDAFRHPAVLAKQAVTLAAASQGRFELGLGWGSWPQEFKRFGIEGGDDAAARVARLGRDLELLREYWGQGENAELTQQPTPSHRIPLVLGGTGKKTMELVRQHADLPPPTGSCAATLPNSVITSAVCPSRASSGSTCGSRISLSPTPSPSSQRQ